MAIFSGIAVAVSAVAGWIGGLGVVGSALLKLAVGVGLSLASQALAGKPKRADSKFSINTNITGGGDLARSFIMGIGATGGSLVWLNTWGTSDGSPNAWLTQVIAVSDLPVKGLREVWVDGRKVTYDYARNNDTANGMSIPEFENNGPNLYIKFYDGNQTGPDPRLTGQDSSSDRPWDANRIGTGVAYVIVRARSSRNLFSGIPNLTFVVDGIPLYDISKDSTRGGDGPHRYDDRSTWGGDGDYLPAVQLYNILRGMNYRDQWIYGLQGVNEARLPPDNWIRQINKCRAQILEKTGYVPTYRSGGQFDISATISDAIENLLTSCHGKIAEAGGIYTLQIGDPDTPLFSITDDDIISTDTQEFTPFYGIADSINGISATYPEPGEGWNAKTAPALLRPDLELRDGNRRLMASVEFTLVPYAEQVQRLMKSALLTALRQRRHTITLPPKYWRYCVPGESVYYTSERNGYVNKVFVIDGVSDKSNLEVVVDIREYDPADYDWQSDVEFQPPVLGELGPIVPPGQSVKDFAIAPWEIKDDQGRDRRPAIRITWDNSIDVITGVVGVEWEIRPFGSTADPVTGATSFASFGAVIIHDGILPDTLYEVRVRFVAQDGVREMLWSGWRQVRTYDIRLSELDVYTDGLVEEIQEQVGELFLFTRDAARQAILDAQRAARLTADQDFGNYRDRQTLRRELASTYEVAKASWTEDVLVATGPNSALALRIEQLTAQVETDIAEAIDLIRVEVGEIDGRVTAVADSILSLSSRVDKNSADGLFRVETRATPDDAQARIALSVSATADGATKEAAMYMDALASDKSRILFVADQFAFLVNGDPDHPFVVDEGGLRANFARLGTITSGLLKSFNNKMEINLDAGTIVIRS